MYTLAFGNRNFDVMRELDRLFLRGVAFGHVPGGAPDTGRGRPGSRAGGFRVRPEAGLAEEGRRAFILPMRMSMIGRFDSATRRMKHWSTVPFTIPPTPDEIDVEYPDGTLLPTYTSPDGQAVTARPEVVKGTKDWKGLEVDQDLVASLSASEPAPRMMGKTVGYYFSPPVWIVGPPSGSLASEEEQEIIRETLEVGIAVSVQRRGVFFFDFTGWSREATRRDVPALSFDDIAFIQVERLEVLNAHLVCLHSSLSEIQKKSLSKMDVTPQDLIMKPSLDYEAAAFAGPRVAALTWSGYRGFPRILELEAEAVLDSLKKLDAVMRHSEVALEPVALLNRAAVYYEEHNYPLAVVTGWTISERLLNLRWNEFLEENLTRVIDGEEVAFINAGRKQKLTGVDFTASIIAEILSLTGRLPYKLFRTLNDVRGARNSWLHKGKGPTRGVAEQAVDSAREMIGEVLGIRLSLPLALGLHY